MVKEPDDCHGPCHQGRAPCPHPEACHIPDEEPDFYGRQHWKETLVDALYVAALCGAVMVVAVVVVTRWAA